MDSAIRGEHCGVVEQVTRSCPHCGGSVELERGARRGRCPLCQREFDVLAIAASNPNPEKRAHDLADATWEFHFPFVMAIVGMTCMAIVASVIVGIVNRANARRVRDRFAHRQTHVAPAIPPPVAPSRPTVWYEPEPAAVAAVGTDRRPGFVGLFAREEGRVGRLWLGGFDAADAKPVWTTGPLGLTAEATLFIHVAVAGSLVVATDAKPSVRLYAADTGAVIDDFPIPERATRLCVGPADEVWIELAHGPGRMLDGKGGHSVPAPRPDWCPAPSDEGPECAALWTHVQPQARCQPSARAPAIDGFVVQRVLAQGELLLALGHDAKGETGMAAFVRGAQKPAWRARLPGALPALADVVDGKVIVKVETREAPFHPHLLAFDVASGRRVWDVELPREEHVPPPRLAAGNERVFVATDGQLQVLDASSGKIVGTVGD
ncbi:MAG: PQQ-binding-like beta-propeller repeat protein [Deltaproteobacteria bacterium]|nr:PQQ-binding-like beta-propeller repeat protein [Deltaproteobacteria bacterium]